MKPFDVDQDRTSITEFCCVEDVGIWAWGNIEAGDRVRQSGHAAIAGSSGGAVSDRWCSDARASVLIICWRS